VPLEESELLPVEDAEAPVERLPVRVAGRVELGEGVGEGVKVVLVVGEGVGLLVGVGLGV
jgi:hypothetical protein